MFDSYMVKIASVGAVRLPEEPDDDWFETTADQIASFIRTQFDKNVVIDDEGLFIGNDSYKYDNELAMWGDWIVLVGDEIRVLSDEAFKGDYA